MISSVHDIGYKLRRTTFGHRGFKISWMVFFENIRHRCYQNISYSAITPIKVNEGHPAKFFANWLMCWCQSMWSQIYCKSGVHSLLWHTLLFLWSLSWIICQYCRFSFAKNLHRIQLFPWNCHLTPGVSCWVVLCKNTAEYPFVCVFFFQ